MIKPTLAAIALSCALAGTASAHDTFLWPSAFTPQVGETVDLRLGSAAAYPEMENSIAVARIERFGASPGEIEQSSASEAAFALRMRPLERGASVVEVQLLPRDIDVEPAEVAHYFDEIGASRELLAAYEAQGRGILRETYSKSVAAIVCAETCEAIDNAHAWTNTRIHFRPLARDGFAPLHVFQLRLNDAPVPLQNVTLTTMDGARFSLRTDADGVILIPHDAHGPLLLSAVILRPPAEPGARWTSDFATLTFWRP